MRGFTFVGYIRHTDKSEEESYFNLYRRASKIYMFSTNKEHNSIKLIKTFNTEKDAEDYVTYTPHVRGFLSWLR